MMNEVNALVWPSPLGVGVLDPVFYGQTVRIAKNAGVIKNDPSPDAYDASIAKEALQAITDVDTKGADFKKATLAGHARRQLSPFSSTRRSEHGPARKGRPVFRCRGACRAPNRVRYSPECCAPHKPGPEARSLTQTTRGATTSEPCEVLRRPQMARQTPVSALSRLTPT